MLVLTRQLGEKITITADDWAALKTDDTVEITVVDLGHGKVRIGFEAPKTVRIIRNELLGGKS